MLTVNELFAGIGSQRAALERLGVEHKVVGIAEIDKFAIKSYKAMWGETKNYGDISKVDKLDYADFWTYSFPCQDISVAGKLQGIEHGKTRSGLLYEVERLLEKSEKCGELPRYLMLENVKNLVGKKFKPQFEEWILRLDELGFNTYWQVLNAKNYGIPQNRERVFGISIRKDIDTGYVFPEPFELKIRLKDILEDEVGEKFYLDNAKTRNLIRQLDYKPTNEIKLNQLGNFEKLANPSKKFNDPQTGRVLDAEGICQALDTMQGGNRQPKVLIPQATKQGYMECSIPGVADLSFPDSKTRRGRVQENGEICPTLMAGQQDICYMEPVIAASRGRNPNNPSDRTPGSPTEQRLEVNQNGTSNTITTVRKDNYVLEPKTEFGRMGRQAIETYNEKQPKYGSTINPFNKTVDNSENSPTLTTRPEGFKTAILPVTNDFRIRKLTPLECWRLMGFTDEQFYKAEKVNSNSQLYKQAGNSIVVDVLYYLFKNLFIDKPVVKQTIEEDQLPDQTNILDFI